MDEQLLRRYYKSLFPADLLCRWLRIDETREISFGLASRGFLRFLTFGSADELVERLLSVVPERIDVGAIYRDRPMKHNSPAVVGKELVFDVDLTDYPRTCCVDKAVCEKCFVLIKAAVRLLDHSLRKELGFERVGFVFSGRRGVHCWVADDAAVRLSDAERGEIVKYYNAVLDRKMYPESYSRILRGYAEDASLGEDELFERMYLRIDKEVTQQTRHLIKAPFSVHPDTKLIAVPIDPETLDSMRLQDLPGLADVLENPKLLRPYVEIAERW